MKAVKISDYEWNYLKEDGSYLLDENVFYCLDFREGFGLFRYNDYTWNFVNSNGKNLLKTNVNNSWIFKNEFAEVKINNIWYYIDKECNFYKDTISFKELYNEYPNMRSELIEIIDKYTYYDVNEYFI